MEPATRYQLSVGAAAMVVVGIFIASFIHVTTFVGSNDNRVWLKDKLNTVTYVSLGGIIATGGAAMFFYYLKPESIMHLLLFMVFMGFGLAWAACAIALIKRK